MRRMTALVATALLAGCQTLPPSTPTAGTPVDGKAAQRARALALGLAGGDCASPQWAMTGRAALSNGKDGGTGRIEWTQGAGMTRLALSAPITRQTWSLEVGPGGATLDGVPNGPVRGPDAAQLLLETTGWDVPVSALGCWLRGVAADSASAGPATFVFASDGLPAQLQQGGWVVDYSAWKPDALSGMPMPGTVTAQRGSSRVRLVVDRWGEE